MCFSVARCAMYSKRPIIYIIGKPVSNEHATPAPCAICGDDATGKHYGSISCDGCKGFFRRSVRRHSLYTCRKSRDCAVTKDMRNQCRYCRLRKCYKCGMKKEAVQNERDKISRHRAYENLIPCLSTEFLRKADFDTRSFSGFFIGSNLNNINGRPLACAPLICTGLKLYVAYLMEWASRIPSYNELSPDDQVMLCKTKAMQLFIFELAYRSIHANDVILLFDICVIPRSCPDPEMTRIGSIMLDELINPITDYQMDETEFCCLKSMIFFDPNTKGLSENVEKIRCWRSQIMANLIGYISERENVFEQRSRFGEILLLMMPLQRISWQLIDIIQYAMVCGDVPIDSLVEEVLAASGNASAIDRSIQRFVDIEDTS